MFNFLGTYSSGEIEGLLAFAGAQAQDIDGRIAYLRAMIERAGWITYSFEDGNNQRPVGYEINPPSSELAKYVAAFHYYGGDILDVYVRSRGDWLYFSQGSPDFEGEWQGGRVVGKALSPDYNMPGRQAGDGVEAEVTGKVKDWMERAIIAKREDWEYRVKRTIDKVDQYLDEIILLVQRQSGAETLEDLRAKIEHFLASSAFPGAGRKLAAQMRGQ